MTGGRNGSNFIFFLFFHLIFGFEIYMEMTKASKETDPLSLTHPPSPFPLNYIHYTVIHKTTYTHPQSLSTQPHTPYTYHPHSLPTQPHTPYILTHILYTHTTILPTLTHILSTHSILSTHCSYLPSTHLRISRVF